MNFPCRIEDCKKIDIGNNITLQGHSKAGERTSFRVMPLNIIIDGGMSSYKTPNAIFVTHSHTDHTLSLPCLTSRRDAKIKDGYRGTPIISHPNTIWKIHKLMHISHVLSENFGMYIDVNDTEQVEIRQGYHCVPCKVGDFIELPQVPNISVEVLQGYHANMTSLGYGFNMIVKKIKVEYKDLSRDEIVKLRKENVEISERTLKPLFLFFCDSMINNLRDHDEWKKYPVIICECTGVEKDVSIECEHTNLSELLPIMLENKDHKYILIHPSMATSDETLKVKEKELQDMELDVIFWTSH